ncbi:MAG: beta-hydroxyacyl-ACP dehydratase [Planctomycetaceae bacterium]|nr:beta-hydroxyacyl-ACP dehydratase [Planctomycetaceae bacterium]
MEYDVAGAIPHRDPFLFIDSVTELTPDSIRAATTLRPDHPLWKQVYSGHYPGNPITPGVLLVEVMLQAAAVLAADILRGAADGGAPVVTRLRDVKFRNVVPPGAELDIRVSLTERLSNAFYMKGSIAVGGRTAVQADFAVAIVRPDAAPQ